MTPLKVSVVMPVYNRAFMIRQVIDSLLHQTYTPLEIVLVDDASSDDSFAVIRQYPQVVARRHPCNRGPAAARNTGLELASGEIVLFLDSDVLAPPDLAAVHAQLHRRRARCIVQGQLVRIMDLDDAFRLPFSLRHYSRSFFDTANVSVPKVHLEAVGGFDEENFRKGWEDLDLGLRLRRRGLAVKRLLYRGYVWHYEGDIYDPQNLAAFFQDRCREGEAAVTFYRKHPCLAVRLMTTAGFPFFVWDRLFADEAYFTSPLFYRRLLSLWESNRRAAAITRMRRAGRHFYLKGLQDRIKRDGCLLPPKKRSTP
jgi:glycosyltransferase involved in cell wall biosynthesis